MTTTTTTQKLARLTGDTYQIRDVLKRHGWAWDAATKTWVKAADWEDEADVIRNVRLYGGVRNRGTLTATVEG